MNWFKLPHVELAEFPIHISPNDFALTVGGRNYASAVVAAHLLSPESGSAYRIGGLGLTFDVNATEPKQYFSEFLRLASSEWISVAGQQAEIFMGLQGLGNID
jgi:hypothetical protein